MCFFKLDVGGALCNTSIGSSSINISQYSEQDFLGLLCLSRSCVSVTSVTHDAEHEGKSWNMIILFMRVALFCVLVSNAFSCIAKQIVEPFTAHYVFALGVARFLSCAHWVLQV